MSACFEFVKFSNELELNVTKGGGIFCRGKLYSKWEEIKIAYGKKMEGKTLMAELEFIGNRDKVEIKAKTVNNQIDLKELKLIGDELDKWKKWSQNAEYFEFHVELTEANKFILTLNDWKIEKIFELDHEPTIKNIKVDADFLKEDFILETTVMPPYLLNISTHKAHIVGFIEVENKTIEIDGIIRKNANSFQIDLIYLTPIFDINYKIGTCKEVETDSVHCSFLLLMEVDFNTNKMVLSERVHKKELFNSIFASPFVRDGIFKIQLFGYNRKFYNITITAKEKFVFNSFELHERGIAYINYFEVLGDVWLFGEPKIY